MANTSVCTVVNKIDSAVDMAHATRLAKKMFNYNDFFAGGTVNLQGDWRVKVLSCIFLDGLGDLWSAAYTVVETTHSISNAGYHTTAICYTNSLAGGQPAGLFAEDSSAQPGQSEVEVLKVVDGKVIHSTSTVPTDSL